MNINLQAQYLLEKKMVDKIQISPSKRAKCVKCENYINKFEVRGKKQLRATHPEYICEKCLKEELSNANNEIENLKKEFDKFSQMNEKQKEIYLNKLKILKNLE